MNALGQCRALDQMRRVVGVVAVVNPEAHDLAAVHIQEQVQIEPTPGNFGRQVGQVPASQLAWPRGDVRGGRTLCRGAWARPGCRVCPWARSTQPSSIRWPGTHPRRRAWARCAPVAFRQSAVRWQRPECSRAPRCSVRALAWAVGGRSDTAPEASPPV